MSPADLRFYELVAASYDAHYFRWQAEEAAKNVRAARERLERETQKCR